jgi:glutamate racemase
VKAILIACGTLSSNTPELLDGFPVPSFGVLRPSIRAMAEVPGRGALGILATAATIRSGAFERALRQACPGREIIPVPCPKLVPLIETGHTDPADPLLLEAAAEYAAPLSGASAVLLGCTHYGIVEEALRRFLPAETVLVSAAACGAAAVREHLEARGLCGAGCGAERYLVSGDPAAFERAASLLLGRSIAGLASPAPLMRIEP